MPIGDTAIDLRQNPQILFGGEPVAHLTVVPLLTSDGARFKASANPLSVRRQPSADEVQFIR
jgi:hypothetical protein